jgi:hypothetical protein
VKPEIGFTGCRLISGATAKCGWNCARHLGAGISWPAAARRPLARACRRAGAGQRCRRARRCAASVRWTDDHERPFLAPRGPPACTSTLTRLESRSSTSQRSTPMRPSSAGSAVPTLDWPLLGMAGAVRRYPRDMSRAKWDGHNERLRGRRRATFMVRSSTDASHAGSLVTVLPVRPSRYQTFRIARSIAKYSCRLATSRDMSLRYPRPGRTPANR